MRYGLHILLTICMLYSANVLFAQTGTEKSRLSNLESSLQKSTGNEQIAILCDMAELSVPYNSDKALEYVAQAEKLINKKTPIDIQLLVWNCYGCVYYHKDNFKKSVSYYEKVALTASKTKLSKTEAYARFNTGVAMKAGKNYRKANAEFDKSLQLAKNLKDISLQIKNYHALYETNKLNKDYKEALAYYNLYINTLTGYSPRLSQKTDILTSEYKGEQKLRLVTESEMKTSTAKIVEMDSALSEVNQHYLELEQESALKSEEISKLNHNAAIKDSVLNEHINEISMNQQTISKQNMTITFFIILGLLVLGIAVLLLCMMQKFKKLSKKLENQKAEIEVQKNLVQVKNEQITDSINYARKIQDSILVPEAKIKRYVPDMFIYYKPKDIVSGDFYWFSKYESKYVITAIDCTGHGVPGAFLSMIGNTLLHEIVNIKHVFKPDLILSMLHTGIMLALNQDSEDSSNEDGMDMSLCTVDTKLNRFQFAGAKNSLYVVQGDKLKILKANYYSIGGKPLRPDMKVQFTCYDFMYDNSTSIYMFSDGYLDQFGGENGEKFNAQRFKDMILKNRDLSMEEQKELFSETMEQWKGDRQQIDDFLVMGIKLSCINQDNFDEAKILE